MELEPTKNLSKNHVGTNTHSVGGVAWYNNTWGDFYHKTTENWASVLFSYTCGQCTFKVDVGVPVQCVGSFAGCLLISMRLRTASWLNGETCSAMECGLAAMLFVLFFGVLSWSYWEVGWHWQEGVKECGEWTSSCNSFALWLQS